VGLKKQTPTSRRIDIDDYNDAVAILRHLADRSLWMSDPEERAPGPIFRGRIPGNADPNWWMEHPSDMAKIALGRLRASSNEEA
jgi:hypothetical protein